MIKKHKTSQVYPTECVDREERGRGRVVFVRPFEPNVKLLDNGTYINLKTIKIQRKFWHNFAKNGTY